MWKLRYFQKINWSYFHKLAKYDVRINDEKVEVDLSREQRGPVDEGELETGGWRGVGKYTQWTTYTQVKMSLCTVISYAMNVYNEKSLNLWR